MFSKSRVKFHPTQPIAHRSNCGDVRVPENTLSAVLMAYKRGGIRYVECDVQKTFDDEVIVLHDETVGRTTDATGLLATTPVEKLTYDQIKHLDAGSKFSPRFAGEKIPTLRDFLQLIKMLNMGLLLEIKGSQESNIKLTEKTVEVLQQCHMVDYPYLQIISFDVDSLRKVRELCPAINLGLLVDEWAVYTRSETRTMRCPGVWVCDEPIETILRELACTSLAANGNLLTPERVAHIKEIVPYVLAWTINRSEQADELLRRGVDAIISDAPVEVIKMQASLSRNTSSFYNHLDEFLVQHGINRTNVQQAFDERCGLVPYNPI